MRPSPPRNRIARESRKSPTRRTAPSKAKASGGALPAPTQSEAAFERLLASLVAGGESALEPAPPPSAVLHELFARRNEFLERDRFATIGEATSFNTKIVGVSFEGRQDRVMGLRSGDFVELERQADNPHDPNAIAVRMGLLPLGFLRREIARRIAPKIDAGERYEAFVTDVTGGGDGRHTGVNLRVRRIRSTATESTAASRQAVEESAIRHALIGERPLRPAQGDVLAQVRAGRSTLAIFGTGRGKSFCFQLPAVERALATGEKTVAFYPLRALANDQYEALRRRVKRFGVRVLRANGAIDVEERENLEAALADGSWDIILATPEFAQHHRDAFARPCNRPWLAVVDEAHHLFDSRHRAAYGTLGGFLREALGAPQVLALTATARDEAFRHVTRTLGIDHWVIDPTVRENLHVVDARETTDKFAYVRNALADDGKSIVYCNSRTEATKIAERLRAAEGDIVAFYHAGLGPNERAQVEELFRTSVVRTIVATSAFGEGVDLPDVRDVYLYHLNFSFTEFNQQAGRAGRDGLDARVHLLYGQADRRINDYIIARDAPSLNTLRELYRGMRDLAGVDGVRMNYEDIARTLALDTADGRTVAAAVQIFTEAGLTAVVNDEDGRCIRFAATPGKVDLTQTTRYAEGEAERESFERFCELALGADALTLEGIVNRPIYPDRIERVH